MKIPAVDLGARWGLNFSGDRRHRAMLAVSSFNGQKQKKNLILYRRSDREETQGMGDASASGHKGVPSEVLEELAASVSKMGIDHVLPNLNDHPLTGSPGRVSGLDSFMDSSEALGNSGSEAFPVSHLSMRDRLLLAKKPKRRCVLGQEKSYGS